MRRFRHRRGPTAVGVVAGLGLFLFGLSAGRAEYMQADLIEVSVNRLIINVTNKLKENPKSVDLWFNLARLHAMAYASKTDRVQVHRAWGNPPGAPVQPWFGYEPKIVPYTLKTTKDAARLKEARRHLKLAIEIHEKVIKLKPDHLAARLGHAWCLQQAGKTQEAVQAYRKTIEMGWAKEKDQKYGGLGGHFITAEAAGYLIPLLDKDKDKDEIATLKARSEKLGSLPRPITPIAIPLRDGLTAQGIVDPRAAVPFDADGSGLLRRWTWIRPDAGWLVIDRHGRGRVRSALQMFGNVTFWCFWSNGYQALSALDDNRDGRLSGNELRGLAVWRDANSNGISDPGEVRPLAHWGIVALDCDYQVDGSHPDKIAFSPHGVRFRDGSTRPTYDVILHAR